ncbi:MAG TPA: acyltransferase [Fimbriimonas sp.]|nr:acyltransferase [Fimbriimonas sp.]
MKRKPAARRAPADRIPFVEGLRGVAALYVVLGHLCSMSDPSKLAGKASKAPLWFQQLIAPFGYGHLAVAAFIVISGFCLQLSLFSHGDGRVSSVKDFFVRRAKRILPAYYACLALSVLIALSVTVHLPGMPFQMYLPVTQQNVLYHVFLIHNYSPSMMYKVNGVLWSIALEAQLYVVFPLLVASLFRIGRWWTLVLASVAALSVLSLAPGALKLYPWFLPLFLIGMISAHLAYRPHKYLRNSLPARILGVAFLGMLVYSLSQNWTYMVGNQSWVLPATDVLMGCWVACLCHAGAVGRPSMIVRALSWKPLLALGGFSYSLYLIHHPIQQLMFWFKPAEVGGEVGNFVYLLATLPVILAAAWAFSLVFERPFMRRRVRPINRRKAFVPVSLPLQSAHDPHGKKARSKSKEPKAVVRIAQASANSTGILN